MSKPLTRMVWIIVLLAIGVAALAGLVRVMEPHMAFFPFAGEQETPRDYGIDYRPLTIDTADGERLHAWHLPHPNAAAQVLYFHGNAGNLSVWAEVFVGLWRQGFEVVAVDYRGYGRSTGSPSEQGLYRDVRAAMAYVDAHLARRDIPLIYWGRSIGATMAAYAAHLASQNGAVARKMDAVVLEAGFPDARAVLQSNPVLLALSLFSSYRFATAEWMQTVRVPALVIHGDRDRIVPYRLGQRLYEAIPGPKRFVAVPGGDHNDPVPADKELYWSAVAALVRSLRD